MDRKKVEKELNIYITRLKKGLKPEKVVLFGSFARGDATEWSDIDVLVIAPFKKISKDKRFDLLYDYQTGLVNEHEFHTYGLTPKEYQTAKPWSIVADIKREGVILYQQSSQ